MNPIEQECAKFISKFEGFVDHVYQCPAGIDTFGYGSSSQRHPGVKFPITKEKAMEVLAEDLMSILRSMTLSIIANINQNQTIALASFIYNIGSGSFYKSTLRRLLNLSKFDQAANEFPKWCHIGGEVSVGLARRREEERKLFLTKVII